MGSLKKESGLEAPMSLHASPRGEDERAERGQPDSLTQSQGVDWGLGLAVRAA